MDAICAMSTVHISWHDRKNDISIAYYVSYVTHEEHAHIKVSVDATDCTHVSLKLERQNECISYLGLA